MSKHQYLISKYHWKSRKGFIKLSADSTILFLGIGSKTKMRNWRKVFYIMCAIASETSLICRKHSKGLLKFFKYTYLLYSLVTISFYLKNGSNHSYFLFQKILKIEMTENKKMLLLYINIDSKCLSINI